MFDPISQKAIPVIIALHDDVRVHAMVIVTRSTLYCFTQQTRKMEIGQCFILCLGLKTIVNALFLSMKPLSEVLFIMVFLLVVIALIGLQSYMGVLRQKCVENPPMNITHEAWDEWVQDEDHTMDGEADVILCGNSTGAG